MILVHNHPTGDPTPSTMDIQFTDKLYNAANIFDIELLDHIVIGNKEFKSVFLETKKLVNKIKGGNI
jgi:DNA repair protein RadC